MAKISEKTYEEIIKAGNTLCAYCENEDDCPKCQVTLLIDDAHNEAIEAGIIENI